MRYLSLLSLVLLGLLASYGPAPAQGVVVHHHGGVLPGLFPFRNRTTVVLGGGVAQQPLFLASPSLGYGQALGYGSSALYGQQGLSLAPTTGGCGCPTPGIGSGLYPGAGLYNPGLGLGVYNQPFRAIGPGHFPHHHGGVQSSLFLGF